jgi:hypothetical protein
MPYHNTGSLFYALFISPLESDGSKTVHVPCRIFKLNSLALFTILLKKKKKKKKKIDRERVKKRRKCERFFMPYLPIALFSNFFKQTTSHYRMIYIGIV